MFRIFILTFLLVQILSPAEANSIVRINGAGATFPYPLYSKWFALYNKNNPGVQFNYQAIGSGGGIRQLIKQTVDFGASDAPMKAEDIKKAPGKIRHIPTVLGAISISYNLPNIRQSLKLDGTILAKIFLGKIKKWSNPALAALNPGLDLPERPILVVRRADGSGTTDIFSDYLSDVSPEWKQKVGRGKTLRWPVGIGAKGNDGVAAQIKNNHGAIGYIELAYSLKLGIQIAALKNRAKNFVFPDIQSISMAAQQITDTKEGISIVNPAGNKAYPISAFTYILLPEEHPKRKHMRKFLHWALTEGQQHASSLHYAPLPKILAQNILKNIQ